MNAAIPCRLCGEPSEYQFSRSGYRKLVIGYFECTGCGSLQTDNPVWLDMAYRDQGTGMDTGAVQRSFETAITMCAVLDLIGFDKSQPCLDFGAGVGLYARMMRDRGYNYFADDLYAVPHYMDRFASALTNRKQWPMISAFEVFEHLPNPRAVLDNLLSAARSVLFFSTELWERQGENWHYLCPEHGQHVFFYSRKALEQLAEKHGFRYHHSGLKIFARPELTLPDLSPQVVSQRAMDLFFQHMREPYRYCAADNAALLGAK